MIRVEDTVAKRYKNLEESIKYRILSKKLSKWCKIDYFCLIDKINHFNNRVNEQILAYYDVESDDELYEIDYKDIVILYALLEAMYKNFKKNNSIDILRDSDTIINYICIVLTVIYLFHKSDIFAVDTKLMSNLFACDDAHKFNTTILRVIDLVSPHLTKYYFTSKCEKNLEKATRKLLLV